MMGHEWGQWMSTTPAGQIDALLGFHQISPGHGALGMSPLKLGTKGHSIPNSQTI